MRRPPLLAVLLTSILVLTACGGTDEAGTGEASPTAAATGGPEASPLHDGVAAVVNGEEIPTELLSARVETAAASPELAEVLAGETGDQARAQLRASILSQLIVNEIVVDGAEERGLAVDDAAIAETRQELTTQAGGEQAFDEQVAAAGLDEDQLTAELEAITALRLVRDDLSPAAGASPSEAESADDAAAGTTPDPADAALQQWLIERLQAAEIAVAPEIGTWDPRQGTVVPAGVSAPVPPEGRATGGPTGEGTPSSGATEE